MGFHHVALATRDLAATHRFYTEVMGFELAKVVATPTPGEGTGFSKHVFYDTGEHGMMAFWEFHDPEIGDDFEVDLNRAAGLPGWANHVAFDAPTRDALDTHRERWQRHGQTVLEVDHEWCVSIYIQDPSGNMVEFCHTTRVFTDDERRAAVELLTDPSPAFDPGARITVHEPIDEPVGAATSSA